MNDDLFPELTRRERLALFRRTLLEYIVASKAPLDEARAELAEVLDGLSEVTQSEIDEIRAAQDQLRTHMAPLRGPYGERCTSAGASRRRLGSGHGFGGAARPLVQNRAA